MSTNPPQLTDEQKAYILNEVERERRATLACKLFEILIVNQFRKARAAANLFLYPLAAINHHRFTELYEQGIKNPAAPLRAQAASSIMGLADKDYATYKRLALEKIEHEDASVRAGTLGALGPLAQCEPELFETIASPFREPSEQNRPPRGVAQGLDCVSEYLEYGLIPPFMRGSSTKLWERRRLQVKHNLHLRHFISQGKLEVYIDKCEAAIMQGGRKNYEPAFDQLSPLLFVQPYRFLAILESFLKKDLFTAGVFNPESQLMLAFQKLALTFDNSPMQPIKDTEYQFLERVLDSDLVVDDKQEVKSSEVLVTELKGLVQQPRNYERLTATAEARKARNLDEVVECAEIVVPGYTLLRKLGEGGSGVVYQAKKRLARVPRRVKIFRLDGLHPLIQGQRERRELMEIVMDECDILAELHHKNLARYFDHGPYTTPDGEETFFIASEYVPGVTVQEALPDLTPEQMKYIFFRLQRVLTYLHQEECVLRDLKLNNVIWAPPKVVKVVDLETITRIDNIKLDDRRTRGSDKYAAPELMAGEKASVASDLFALGACALYMLRRQVGGLQNITTLPPRQYNKAIVSMIQECVQAYVEKGLHHFMDKEHPNRFVGAWLYKCLRYEPTRRLEPIQSVIEHTVI